MKPWHLGALASGWLIACVLNGCSSPQRAFATAGAGGTFALAGQGGVADPSGGRASGGHSAGASAAEDSGNGGMAGEGEGGVSGQGGEAGAMPVTPLACEPGTYACDNACVLDGNVNACGASCSACAAVNHGSPACISGTCAVHCATGYHVCKGECVDDTSVLSCGTGCEPCTVPTGGSATCASDACGASCPSGKKLCLGTCIASDAVCDGTCPSGSHPCNGLCLANSSTNSCGTLCTACPLPTGASSASCDGTTCGLTCGTGYHRCGSACAANNDATQCGSSCANCPGTANGSASCTNDACTLKCDSGYHLCGSTCSLNTSLQTCGTTSNSCTPCTAPANATATCDGTSCGFTCKAGYTGPNCEFPRMQTTPLPTGYTGATITGMSDDGSIVVGTVSNGSSSGNMRDAFRWTTSSSTMVTGSVTGQVNAGATTISGDGTRIYGRTDSVVFEWRLNQAPAQMLNIPAKTTFAACNTTGLTVAGTYSSAPNNVGQPFIYDVTSATMSKPTSPAYPASTGFNGISGDGLTAVGWAYRNGDAYPIRWTSAGFTELPGGIATVYGMSPNGQYAVGIQFNQAALWSGPGLQTVTKFGQLASLPNWGTIGRDVSQDGTVVVGRANPPTGGTTIALIWTSAGGLQRLSDALAAAGIDVSAWEQLREAEAVSSNGKIIAGTGVKGGVQLGFVARLP